MKTIEQLRDFFSTELRQEILAVESKRKRIVYKVVALFLVGIVITVGLVYSMLQADMSIGWLFFVILVIPFLIMMIYFELINNRDFYNDFKTRVIERIVKFVDPSFTYISHKHIKPVQLVDSRMFAHLPKKYKGDDYVVGTIAGDLKVEFSEVHARHKAATEGKNAEWSNTFKGLFFVAEVPNAFKGQTFVLPAGEGVEVLYSSPKNPMPTPQSVEVGDQNFRNLFHVYSTAPEEAKALLESGDLQQRLVDFRSHRANPVRFSFINNHINVGIWHEKDLFEPKIYKSLLDFSIIEEYYDDLYQAISVMEQIAKKRS